MSETVTRRLRIEGHVQGVGFRWFARDAARALGVTGWVRNLPDGSVEALVQGEPAAVETLVTRLRQGPPGSRVDALLETPVDTAGHHEEFTIRG